MRPETTVAHRPFELDDEAVHSTLLECASDVLESMFYCGIMGPMEEETAVSDYYFGLEFHGQFSGQFAIGLPSHTAHVLAENFEGDDSSPPEELVASVIAELTNILCGALLSRLDRNGLFDLGTPTSLTGLPEGGYRISLELEEGHLTAVFRLPNAA
jgi:CheY-specific phosphatase CheX